MTVVFPGLQCDMTSVITSIGYEGLLGTEVLQSCLAHQFDLWTGSCGPMDSPHCSFISNGRRSACPRILRVREWYHRIVIS